MTRTTLRFYLGRHILGESRMRRPCNNHHNTRHKCTRKQGMVRNTPARRFFWQPLPQVKRCFKIRPSPRAAEEITALIITLSLCLTLLRFPVIKCHALAGSPTALKSCPSNVLSETQTHGANLTSLTHPTLAKSSSLHRNIYTYMHTCSAYIPILVLRRSRLDDLCMDIGCITRNPKEMLR